jgi:hypothetical protein
LWIAIARLNFSADPKGIAIKVPEMSVQEGESDGQS